MTWIILDKQNDARKASDDTNAALGMPWAGRAIGGGIHVQAPLGATVAWAEPKKHPQNAQWAYLAAAALSYEKHDGGKLAGEHGPKIKVANTATACAELDATWKGATQTAVTAVAATKGKAS